ncbi:MAG: RNA methyltransferase [Bacteroidetes bacterium]|nr:RNA methyltransferase [Bacteroidota bacterium]
MITKAQVKHIRSLDDKNYRRQFNEFVVEGEKMLSEVLRSGFEILMIYAVDEWVEKYKSELKNKPYQLIPYFELEKISQFKTPNQVLAVVKIPVAAIPSSLSGLTLILDDIRDPGNLGTIIRIADWFGIQNVICSIGSVDVYGSKVIQATMGSVFRVGVFYTDLKSYILSQSGTQVIGTSLMGKDIREFQYTEPAFLLIGNESKGLSQELEALCSDTVKIPQLGQAESLNAAVATGIICHALLC